MYCRWFKRKLCCHFLFFISAETSDSDVQAVLIDCSSVIFVDVAGARLFTQVSQLKEDNMLQTSLYMVLSISPWIVSVRLIAFGVFCRCALNARKLEFMCIWRTAMVRPIYLNYLCPNAFLCYILCLYFLRFFFFQKDDTYLFNLPKIHSHTIYTDQWFLSP